MSLLIKNSVLRHSLVFLIYIVILLLLPLLVILTTLLLVIRGGLTMYKKICRPEFGDLMSGVNNLYSGDSPYDNPIVIVSSYSFVRGQLTLEAVTKLMTDAMHQFATHRPHPIYPEIHQYPTTLGGFSVWKNEKNYQLSDHIKTFNLPELNSKLKWRTDGPDWTVHQNEKKFDLITEDNAADLAFLLTRVPFVPEKSPWEIILHHNVKLNGESEPSTLFLWRFHHTLADALSGVNLMSKLTDDKDVYEKFIAKFSKSVVRQRRGRVHNLVHILTYPFLGIYELVHHVMDIWDDNVWHRAWPPKLRTEFNYATFHTLSTERVKRIRRVQGDVKFFSVLLAALTGGLRKFMSRRGIPIPKSMHAVVSVPIPKDPKKLSNSVTGTMFNMPMEENDRTKIVQMIDEESAFFKTSRIPLTLLALLTFLGLLPRKFLMHYWIFTTVGTSNFPGFDSQIKINGLPVLSMRALASLPATTGVYFWVAGYMGNLDICMGVSKDIMASMVDVRECQKCVEEEFDALENIQNRFIVPDSVKESNGKRKAH